MPAKGIGMLSPPLPPSTPSPSPGHVIVVSGGAPPPHGLIGVLAPPSAVVCADRGYTHALTLGLTPTLLVGDFDSLAEHQIDEARASGVLVELHPTEKDATDLELALDRAVDGAVAGTLVTVVATPDLTERIDHLLAQLGLLASPKYAHVTMNAWFGEAFVTIVHPHSVTHVRGTDGELVTIIPIGGEVTGVTTIGLRYPLANESLSPFATRGVSNILASSPASVHIITGVAAVIRPHALRGM